MILTDRAIRDAKPKASAYRLRDSNVVCRGFGVTVGPTGAKAFFLSYTSPEDGKRKQAPLGRFPATSLREARLKAAEVRALVDEGRDPAIEKKQLIAKRIEQRELGSLQDLMDLYADDLKADGKRSEKEVRRITGRDIPPHLLSRPARLITRDDILDILTPIAQRGAKVHADNVRAYLRAAFELGVNAPSMTRWRGRSKSFGITINPVIGVRKSVSRKARGQRTLTPAEVRMLWSTDALTPLTLLALKLTLSTGQRVEEVLGAKWHDFNFEEGIWVIPGQQRKTRNSSNVAHIVPITDFHRILLDEIRSLNPESLFLFPDRSGKSPKRHDSLNSSLRRWIKEGQMPTFSPRDLRRTFKTLCGAFGIPLEVRNRLQGHAMTDVGSIFYDRHDYLAEKRESMQKWVESFKLLIG
jgi:integrase